MRNQLIYDHSFLSIKEIKENKSPTYSLFSEPHLNCKCAHCSLKKNGINSLSLNKNIKFQDFEQKIEDIAKKNLKELIAKLNEYHKVNLNYRSWKLILWPWLYTLTTIIFEIQIKLKQQKGIGGEVVTIDVLDLKHVIPFNYEASTQLLKTQEVYDYILSIVAKSFFKEVKLKIKPKKLFITKKSSPQGKLLNLISFVLNFLTRKSSYIFFKSYLPMKYRLKLIFMFFSFPVLSASVNEINIEDSKIDFVKRNSLDFSTNVFLAISMLIIPKSYLENFKSMYSASLKVFPRNPKLIYTANAHIGSDMFNIWAAHKLGKTKFFLGQHGGHYGVGKASNLHAHEFDIADAFFSWGWSDKSYPKVVPLGTWVCPIRHKPDKQAPFLFIIAGGSSKYISSTISMPIGEEWKSYLKDIKDFALKLNRNKIKKVILRPYHSNIIWDQVYNFDKNIPNVILENTNSNIERGIQRARLVICTWNSTNFLHLLLSNIPFLCFWNPELFKLEEAAKPPFNELLKAKIMHFDKKKAGLFANKIWPNVEDWWFSDATQNARDSFISKYCLPAENNRDLFFRFIKNER